MITDFSAGNVKNDKKEITGKKSIITACNVDYRLKRSGPMED